MTIQEAKTNYEVQKVNYENADIAVNDAEKAIKEGVKQVVKDMYGVEVTRISLHTSSWTESISLGFFVPNGGDVDFRINSGKISINFPRFTEDMSADYITLCGSLLMDYTAKTGGFSVIQSLALDLNNKITERRTASYELDKVRTNYENLKRSKKKEVFFSIVKDGDIIKKNNREYWKVTKITQKCVYAISKDYSEVRSRRYKKDEFFAETNRWVNLEEVES